MVGGLPEMGHNRTKTDADDDDRGRLFGTHDGERGFKWTPMV